MFVDLEHYRIFYHVAKAGSFTQAGEVLCISQPAVSQAIRLLEEELGSRLFIRIPKGVKLTPEGEVLYSYIQRGYEFILLGEAQFQKMINLESGEIRIGASDMTLEFYLLPVLERFHEQYPGIKFTITNAPTPETIEYLYQGKIDFGVISEPFQARPEVDSVRVRQIQDVFIAGSRFSDLRGRILNYKSLETLPIICLEQNTSSRRFIDDFLQDNGVILKPEFELAMSDIIVKFTERNLGIGHVVRDFAEEYIKKGQLFELKFDKDIPPRSFCIITGKQNPISNAAKKLLEMMSMG